MAKRRGECQKEGMLIGFDIVVKIVLVLRLLKYR